MRRTQIFLPQNLHSNLKKEADSQGVTLSELIRTMLQRQVHLSSRDRTEKGIQVLLEMGSGKSDAE